MSGHSCYHCGGSGDENAQGPSQGGCRVCLGSGHIHHKRQGKVDPLWYLTTDERTTLDADNARTRREHEEADAALADYLDRTA